jgi:uncharacterized protein
MGAIVAIFYNRSEKRLRAGWRLLIHLIALMVLVVGAGVVAAQMPDRISHEIAAPLLSCVAVVGATWLVGRFIDRRRFAEFGFHISAGWWVDFVFGLVLGVALMCGIVAAMLGAGWATLSQTSGTDLPAPVTTAFAIQVLAFIVVGINEELVFRGYHLRNMGEGFSRFGANTAIIIALLISSSIFGLGHLSNEMAGGAHTTSLALLNLILAGLVMLAVPYLLTGELAIPIGIHITWNLFQGPVFGLAVSGIASDTHLMTVTPTGPEMWTGGDYGAEGGLLATIAVVIGVIISAIWVYIRKCEVKFQKSVVTYAPR